MKIPYLAIFRLKLEKTITRLDFSTFNLSKCNISCKRNFFKCRPKLYYLGLFVRELGRATLLWYFTPSPIFLNRKFQTKIKILKFGTNIALIGYFRLEFQKSNILFVISFREFVSRQSFIQNKKTLNLSPKAPYLGIFGLQFNKNYCKIFKQHSQICENKVSSKTKKIFFRPKMLYLPLWAGMLKNYCHICNQRPPIYLMAKFRAKMRILKFGFKNALFGCFG